MRREDFLGRKFGKWLAVQRAPSVKGETMWECRCDCGTSSAVYTKALKRKMSVSCGCGRESHGEGDHHTPEYRAFCKMKDRCQNPKNRDFRNYGGRGISVEFQSYASFLGHIGRRPSPGHSVDRIRVNGNYAPGNVRWATAREQANNMRCNRVLMFGARSQTLAQWARETGINHSALERRLNLLGWSVERALTTPVRKMTDHQPTSENPRIGCAGS